MTASSSAAPGFRGIVGIIAKREFLGYFRTPVAYVFLALFAGVAVGFPWFILRIFESGYASMVRFNVVIPWILAIFASLVGMRLWSEERRSGTWELLFTFPLSLGQAVLGKFLAAWLFMTVGILLTLPLPLTFEWLGEPDWGPIFGSYLGMILMAGAFLGLTSLFSAITRNQIIAALLGVAACLLLVVLGFGPFTDSLLAIGLPLGTAEFVANLSVVPHFDTLSKGLVKLSDIVYFLGLGGFALWANALILER